MAKNDDKKLKKSNKRIQDIASNIQDNMDSLYTTTYFSTPQTGKDAKNIFDDITDNIDGIISRNMDTFGMPSVSVLYTRLFEKNGNTSIDGKNVSGDIEKLFEDPLMMDDLYSTFMGNRYLKELDQEIDTVCRYMPNLEIALDAKADSVLSADHFAKDFLNIKYPIDADDATFAQRIKELKKKYDLQGIVEKVYKDTAKYGEKFIYNVPYKDAISKLLANKDNTNPPITPRMATESFVLTEAEMEDAFHPYKENFTFTMNSSGCTIKGSDGSKFFGRGTITESVYNNTTGKMEIKENPILTGSQGLSFNIEINSSGIIQSAVQEANTKIRVSRKTPKSLRKIHEESIVHENIPSADGNLNNEKLFKTNFGGSTDGLIGHSTNPDDKQFQVDLPGAVVKYLNRENVIPIYIEENCLGYYYIEIRSKDAGNELVGFRNLLGDPLSGAGTAEGRANFNNIETMRQEDTLKYIAGQLSRFIDKKFVNTNQDLAKEIYAILKFNDVFNSPSIDLIKITFVPPEDIVHSYFTFDEESHRGLSDLSRGLIPAKLYASLYVTNSIGIMTRGQDKRVYYVRQSVDTNIAQQLMNVVNQIKMGNFGIRQFNSINTILNITGRFNDYIIPRSMSGDSPIDIDVLQGQQFDVHTDLMDVLEHMAIESTDVPYDIVQTRQSIDYASQLSMSSSRFLRTTYKRQEAFQKIIAPLISNIYNYEYGENVDLEVTLPPPVFLDMANTNQLINNTKDFVDSCIDTEMQDEQDDRLKSRYRKNLFMHYIGTHVDISAHKQILEQTKVELKTEDNESQIPTENPPEEDNYGGGDWG